MDFQFSPEDEAFRLEVRQFIRENLPEKLRRRAYYGMHDLGRDTMVAWARILAIACVAAVVVAVDKRLRRPPM